VGAGLLCLVFTAGDPLVLISSTTSRPTPAPALELGSARPELPEQDDAIRRTDGRAAYLYLLFEHQSEPDRLMAFRLLRYLVRILERHQGEHPGNHRLPAVLPLVLHHGKGGWTEPVELVDLYDLDPAELAACRDHLPAFRFVLDDLARVPDEQIRRRPTTARAKLTSLAFKHGRQSADLAQRLPRWDGEARGVVAEPQGRDTLGAIVRYILDVSPHVTPEQLVAAWKPAAGDIVEEVAVTYVEKARAEGRERGLSEGRAVEARAALLRVIARRGFDLPAHVRERIEREKDLARLERWLDDAVTAVRLEDMFQDS
jgi:hypothetical protein